MQLSTWVTDTAEYCDVTNEQITTLKCRLQVVNKLTAAKYEKWCFKDDTQDKTQQKVDSVTI